MSTTKKLFSITAENNAGIAVIQISGAIDGESNAARTLSKQIDGLLEQGINDVSLYINSQGGSVFEANDIANELIRFKGRISGYGGAIVASAASYLSLICHTFEMAENGQFMYHKPHAVFAGNEDRIKADTKLLENLTAMYRKAYAQKAGISEDEIEARWSKGDVWLTANDALSQGFITGITAKKANKSLQGKIAAIFGLPGNASESTILDSIKQGVAAFESGILESNYRPAIAASYDPRASWTLQDYLDKDPKALNQLERTDPAKFIALNNAHYGIDLTKGNTQQPGNGFNANSGTDPRASWTVQDYLDRDPQALKELERTNPDKWKALHNTHYQTDKFK